MCRKCCDRAHWSSYTIYHAHSSHSFYRSWRWIVNLLYRLVAALVYRTAGVAVSSSEGARAQNRKTQYILQLKQRSINHWTGDSSINSFRFDPHTQMPEQNTHKKSRQVLLKYTQPNTSHFNQFQSSEFRSHRMNCNIVAVWLEHRKCCYFSYSRTLSACVCVSMCARADSVCDYICFILLAFCEIHCVYTGIWHGSWFASISCFFSIVLFILYVLRRILNCRHNSFSMYVNGKRMCIEYIVFQINES